MSAASSSLRSLSGLLEGLPCLLRVVTSKDPLRFPLRGFFKGSFKGTCKSFLRFPVRGLLD